MTLRDSTTASLLYACSSASQLSSNTGSSGSSNSSNDRTLQSALHSCMMKTSASSPYKLTVSRDRDTEEQLGEGRGGEASQRKEYRNVWKGGGGGKGEGGGGGGGWVGGDELGWAMAFRFRRFPYVMLYYLVLCYVVFFVVLCYVMLCFVMLC